jgi:hypothetical protein
VRPIRLSWTASLFVLDRFGFRVSREGFRSRLVAVEKQFCSATLLSGRAEALGYAVKGLELLGYAVKGLEAEALGYAVKGLELLGYAVKGLEVEALGYAVKGLEVET